MTRVLVCGIALLGLTTVGRAGELDKETKAPPTAPAITATVGSELDAESPTAAHRRGGWGYYGGYYGGWGGGWGGYYGGYRPVVTVGFGGYGGWGGGWGSYYPSYYRSYYSPVIYSGFGYYGGRYCW